MTDLSHPPCVLDEQEIYSITKQGLVNKIFLGSYTERRYVGVLGDYRDVIEVGQAEVNLKQCMQEVRSKLEIFYGVKWIGIGVTDKSTHCFWTNKLNVPFGQYWFKIRHARFENGEIYLKLKCLRAVHVEDTTPASKTNLDSKGSDMVEYSFSFDPWGGVLEPLVLKLREFAVVAHNGFTLENILLALKITLASVVAIVSVLIAFVRYTGEYFLRLLRELSIFLHTVRPIILKVIDMVTKTIGGLYILLAMMWRGKPPQQPGYPSSSRFALTGEARQSLAKIQLNRQERNRHLREEFLNKS